MVQYFPVVTGSLTVQGNVRITGSINATAGITGSISGIATTALTASSVANLNQNVVVTGSLTTTGQIVAQTLNVQQVTSSIVFSSGSNVFGNSTSNTQQMTGSVSVTGSFAVTTTGTELQVGATGVTLGNALTDIHNATGSLRVTGSIGVAAVPAYPLDIYTAVSSSQNIQAQFFNDNFGSGVRNFIRVRNGISLGATYSSYFGQGADGKTYIIANDLTRNDFVIDGSSGYVGIGTASPNDLLEVRGGFIRLSATSGNGPQFNLYSNGQTSNHVTLAQGFALATDNIGYLINRANADFVFGTNNTERMRITSGGNIGIGVATANWDSTIRSIEIGNRGGFYAGFNSAAISVIYLGTNAYYNEGWKYANTSVYRPQILDCGDGNFHFQNASAGTAGNAITWNSLMRITSAGNVGIGTNDPLTRLDVRQAATGAATVNSAFRDSSTNGNALQIWNGNNEARFRAVYYGTPSDQNITFYTIQSNGSEAERIRITSQGVLRFSNVPFNNYQIDSSISIAVANGGTIPFETFSGLVIINNMSNGNCVMWLCGAGVTSIIGQSGGGGATGTLSYSVGINGYIWTAAQTANYGVFAVRTRANA